MADIGSVLADLVEGVQIEVDPRFVSNSRKMKRAVCGASERHINGDGVLKRIHVDDIARLNVFFNQLHDLHSGMLRKHGPRGIYRRDGSVSGKRKADGFAEAVHGVCGEHAGAGSACRTAGDLSFGKLRLIDQACLERADCLEHL